MSVAVWLATKRPYRFESDLGHIVHPETRPDTGDIGELMLVDREYADSHVATDFDVPIPMALIDEIIPNGCVVTMYELS